MKKFSVACHIVCLGSLLATYIYIVDEAVDKVEAITHLDDRAEQAEKYSLDLLDVVKSLSHENTLLCERDEKTFQVVREFEDENRRLKGSLSDAVTKLKDQQTEINSLIDQNTDLRNKVRALEALDALTPDVE